MRPFLHGTTARALSRGTHNMRDGSTRHDASDRARRVAPTAQGGSAAGRTSGLEGGSSPTPLCSFESASPAAARRFVHRVTAESEGVEKKFNTLPRLHSSRTSDETRQRSQPGCPD